MDAEDGTTKTHKQVARLQAEEFLDLLLIMERMIFTNSTSILHFQEAILM